MPFHESFDESDGLTTPTTTHKNSKRRGRRGNWTSECLEDFIDIITGDEYYKNSYSSQILKTKRMVQFMRKF